MFLLLDGHQGGGQLRQRGTHRHYGQANDQIADAKCLGYGHRTPHQQAGSAHQEYQAHDQPEDGLLERHGFAVDLHIHVGVQGVSLPFDPGPDGPAKQPDEDATQNEGVATPQVTIDEQGTGQQGDAEQYGDLLAHHLGGDGDGADEGCQSENEGDVGDVGAIGIAQGQARVTLHGCQGRDHHLGGRGTKTDDHHADQERRHAGITGGGGGAVHKFIRTPDQQRQSGNQGNKSQGHILPSHRLQTREPGG
ncbi:hypothetical protein D3C84_676220 [compost metagenome]